MKRRRFELMDIESPPGTKVVLWKPKNGWPADQDRIKRLGMKKYQEFTVARTIVYDSSTTVYLVEFPDEQFNSVNFGVAQNASVEGRGV